MNNNNSSSNQIPSGITDSKSITQTSSNLSNIIEPFKNEEGLLETDLQLDHLLLIRIQSSKKEDEDEDIEFEESFIG